MGRKIGIALALIAGAFFVWPTGRYLTRAAYEEARILSHRRAIAELLKDPATDADTRHRLQLVVDARKYAVDSLGLVAGESFTTYAPVEHDTLVLVLSVAYRDKLAFRSWWFPIVGSVPYKGWFDFDAARKAEREYQHDGYDTYLRPSEAFSTLGYFNDPLLSTTLHGDTVNLAETVIHELTHNAYYAPGQAIFNESFANFVGSRGAERFFAMRGDTASARIEGARFADEMVLGAFWGRVYARVDSAFKAHPGTDSAMVRARIAARDSIFTQERHVLKDSVATRLTTYDTSHIDQVSFDNAALLARRIYRTNLDLFDQMLLLKGGDLRAATHQIIALAKSRKSDPYAALREYLTQATSAAAR